MATCKLCGAQIKWIRTLGGGNMPCDPEKIYYRIDNHSPERIVTDYGAVIPCRTMNPQEEDAGQADGWGYVPHFATCKGGIAE